MFLVGVLLVVQEEEVEMEVEVLLQEPQLYLLV
jgi:hypothetical protein